MQMPMEERRAEASRVRARYPGHIPIIVTRVEDAASGILEQHKFLIPRTNSVLQFLDICHEKFDARGTPAGILVCQGAALPPEDIIRDVEATKKAEDNVVYMHYERFDGVRSTERRATCAASKLWQNRIHSDAVVVCNGCPAGTFPVHRAVMATASPVFDALFQTEWVEGAQRRIELAEASPEVEAMLHFVYTGSTTHLLALQLDVVGKVLALAHLYEIDDLIEACAIQLSWDMDLAPDAVRTCMQSLRPYREHRLVQRHWASAASRIANNVDLIEGFFVAEAITSDSLSGFVREHSSLFASALVGNAELMQLLLTKICGISSGTCDVDLRHAEVDLQAGSEAQAAQVSNDTCTTLAKKPIAEPLHPTSESVAAIVTNSVEVVPGDVDGQQGIGAAATHPIEMRSSQLTADLGTDAPGARWWQCVAEADFDGLEVNEDGNVDSGYLPFSEGESLQIHCSSPQPGHHRNRYAFYCYGRTWNGRTWIEPPRQGWLPVSLLAGSESNESNASVQSRVQVTENLAFSM